MANQVDLSEDQLKKLRSITGDGKSNFVEGYKYINSIVQNNQKVDAPTKFFFRGAQEVNADDPRSEANTFIRAVTKADLAWDRRSADVQETSNMIAGNVVRQILEDRGIPALATILTEDVNSAIGKGLQSIGGWGAAFYFWNTPIEPSSGKIVGQKIMEDTEQFEKFIAINTKALVETAAKHGLNPAQLLQRLDTAYKAQAPLNLKSDIATRAYEVIVEGQSLTGDPDRIDGHRAIRGYPTGEIKGWRGEGGDIADQGEIDKLTRRSEHRIDWGLDHEWQNPSFERRTEMKPAGAPNVMFATPGSDRRDSAAWVRRTSELDGLAEEDAFQPY